MFPDTDVILIQFTGISSITSFIYGQFVPKYTWYVSPSAESGKSRSVAAMEEIVQHTLI